MNERIKLVIEFDRRWNYFQWFLFGFYELKNEGKIEIQFKTGPLCNFSFFVNNKYLSRVIRKLFFKKQIDSYYFDGYIITEGKKKTFTIDCADTPYMFDYERLKNKDIYFKIQYPCDIDKPAFNLTKEIEIPWIDSEDLEPKLRKLKTETYRREIKDFVKYKSKIKPLMLGPRELSIGNSYSQLKEGYENFISSYNENKSGKGMCYFGSAKGPLPSKNIKEPDYGLEYDLLGWFKERINHPNEKRAKLAELLGDKRGFDCRVIQNGNADINCENNKNLYISLKEFPEHVSKFEYNFNISGYTLSIPSRFIDSFAVGTAVVTDKLHCKWYLPFDKEEVIETIEMGYEPDGVVDWEAFLADVDKLKKTSPSTIKKLYEKKWAPKVVAQYIINTVIEEGD